MAIRAKEKQPGISHVVEFWACGTTQRLYVSYRVERMIIRKDSIKD